LKALYFNFSVMVRGGMTSQVACDKIYEIWTEFVCHPNIEFIEERQK